MVRNPWWLLLLCLFIAGCGDTAYYYGDRELPDGVASLTESIAAERVLIEQLDQDIEAKQRHVDTLLPGSSLHTQRLAELDSLRVTRRRAVRVLAIAEARLDYQVCLAKSLDITPTTPSNE